MTPRKRNLLRAIVRQYALTGEPIGSKTLAAGFGSVSSATLRSEMNELSQMGYLSQPHTSAGRIPTYAGLRFYVDHLLVPRRLNHRERAEMKGLLPDGLCGLNEVLKAAVSAVAELTHYAAVSATPADSTAKITKLELFPVGRNAGMLVLLTDHGVIKSRVCRLEEEFTTDHFTIFNRMMTQSVCGRELAEISAAFLQTIAVSMENPFLLLPLVSIAGELAAEAAESEIYTLGEMADLLKCSREVLTLLSDNAKHPDVLIGEETGIQELSPCALVFSAYSLGETAGRIGVVGPVRMDFDIMIPRLEYFAELITELLKDGFG